MFSETSKYQQQQQKKKKADTEFLLILKYVVENTRLEKKNHTKYICGQTQRFF